MTIEAIEPAEGLAQAVARRIRGIMGERRLSGSALALQLGMTQQALSRRTTGATPFRLDELAAVAEALQVSEAYLLGFTDDRSPRSGDRGLSGQYAIRDSNPEPADYSSLSSGRGAQRPATGAVVVPLPRRRNTAAAAVPGGAAAVVLPFGRSA